ncbi:hypothetical protein [Thiocystis violacea]|uniref:hypothetical protein n=1 Tax=Thiocystis violacea TaxID=13725 RepID=UPI0019086D92|nr:hypothetical protein [Thiocystis violacea]MBK1722010.1 hypothetical protein [Thiocystis violacea]
MKTMNRDTGAIPGIAPTVSELVKEEAARWRDAASANHWSVLDLPELKPAAGQDSGAARQAYLSRRERVLLAGRTASAPV